MTNCSLGDIARVTGLRPAAGDANDRFVRCMAACMVNDEPGWELDRPVILTLAAPLLCPFSGKLFEAGERVQFTRIKDQYLRPIRGGLTDSDVSDEAPANARFPGVNIDSVHTKAAA